MSKKTIKINPELFQLSSDKTKKNREKKQRPLIPPIINPNSIKKQLLNKIKEHKTQEKKDLDKKKSNEDTSMNRDFSDEFQDSIEYLSSLSKQKREKEKEKEKENNFKKDLNVGHSYSEKFHDVPYVEIEWPDELANIPTNSSPIKINKTVDNNVPYGCLKNGSKPTYRAWKENQTRKNYSTSYLQENLTNSETYHNENSSNFKTDDSFSTNEPEIINNYLSVTNSEPVERSQLNAFVADRERKLAILKNKLREQQDAEKEKTLFNTPLIVKPGLSHIRVANTTSINENQIKPSENLYSNKKIKEEPQTISIKRTIRRKYKLGKSIKNGKVGVLIKDKQTRKRIIDAEKELKKKSIQEVKKYLKDRGLIKAGSNAPNDVLRKTYESAKLSGEIANVNRETLMHNLLNETHN